METHESIPEWNIFERIEKLEALKPTAEDSLILAGHALLLGFIALVKDRPKTARKLKDSFITHLETTKLSPEILKEIERTLIIACDEFEGQG